MTKLWFDCSGVADGSTPLWVGTPPSLVTAVAAGSVLQIRDLRGTSAFWYSDILTSAADVECLIKFRTSTVALDSGPNTRLGLLMRKSSGSFTGNFYAVYAGSGGEYRNGLLRLRPSGSNSDFNGSSVYPASQEMNVWRFMRAQCTSTTIRARWWDETESEPGSWDVSQTNATLTSGEVAVVFPFTRQHMTEVAYVSIGTAGDPPPTVDEYSVDGIVRDDTNTAAQRTVRLVHRLTGKVVSEGLSDAGTGAYSLGSPFADELIRTVLDDSSGSLYNDIHDRVIPA